MLKKYLKPTSKELTELLLITLTLSLLFSLTYMRFSNANKTLIEVFIIFFIFITIMQLLRLAFMKYTAYRNGFEIHLKMTYFDRYWFRNYDRISYTTKQRKITQNITGIAMPIVSIIIYILTLGFVIFPCMWRYSIKQIPHKFIGTKQKFEKTTPHEITLYRYSKVLFSGFLFYLIFSYLIKILISPSNEFFFWFMFIIFYIAFVSLIPILGTEGFEFWLKGRFGWISTITILFLGMLAILILQNMIMIITVTIISVLIVITVMLWKDII